MLWCRFQQCLGKFTMLFDEGYSEIGLFTFLLTTFSEYIISEIQNLWGLSVSKLFKFNLDFENTAKNWEKFFLPDVIASEFVS